MESREAPLVSLNDTLISFTINVSPNKYVNNKLWSKYTTDEQKQLLTQAIMPKLEQSNLTYEFELTKAGYVHVHGMFQSNMDSAEAFQEIICKRFGMPKLPYDVCCTVKPVTDAEGWKRYMNKCKEENSPNYIPVRSMFIPIEGN